MSVDAGSLPFMVSQVRPTLRALKLLPADSFDSAPILSTLARARNANGADEKRAILGSLTLWSLDQPLLNDARDLFDQGTPDQHKSSTAAAGRPVYEVRSTTGAAWRGGVIVDGDTAWLIFADVHDRFHESAAEYIKTGSWAPSALDMVLRDRDVARVEARAWEIDLLTSLLEHLCQAAASPDRSTFTTPLDAKGKSCSVDITVEHDPPAPGPELAHTSTGLVYVTVRSSKATWATVERMIPLLDFIQAASTETGEVLEPAFLPGGDLLILMTLTHARLAQLSAQVSASGGERPVGVLPVPTHLHYVGKVRLARSFVQGDAVQGLCGVWFVPVTDGSAALPVCGQCEETQPIAQQLLDMLRT